jgi:hypothetical protein
MFIHLAAVFLLTAILSGIITRLWLRYSIAQSSAVAGVVLLILYALLLIAIVALRR